MKLAAKQDLLNWIDQLNQDLEVVAPIKLNGHHLFKPISDSRQIEWGNVKTPTPIKSFFFHPTEQLMTIVRQGEDVIIRSKLQEHPRVIIGVRPCDAHGLEILDAMFLDTQPVDLNYNAHRENTILVGLACESVEPTCFCTSMGGGPDDTTGLDILLTRVDDGFIVEVVSERGEDLTCTLEASETSMQKPAPPEMKTVPAPDLLNWEQLFDLPIWEHTAERCLSCRACAYLCPTCRCFDVRDEPVRSINGSQEYERIRVWDSCASESYRKIAGGHNPRKAKTERLRNRLFCKFDYYPEQYGPMACTGCGRCIEHCPVNIDLVETLTELAEITR